MTALIGWREGGNVTSAEWQVTLCDPIRHWVLGEVRQTTILRTFTFLNSA